ncbi:MAG: hypothetical protein ACTSO9_03365 [Candidatus Helarchaeota archaeon]
MKHRLINVHTVNLILILAVSLGISGIIYFAPQSFSSPTYPITPFMSYYTKYNYTQGDDLSASLLSSAITIVWISKIINSTTIEISQRDIETTLIYDIPTEFKEIKTYQVNLVTRKTNSSEGSFLFWAFPYWTLTEISPETPLPVTVGNNTNYIFGEENRMVLEIIRNTKVAWFWSEESITVANYDKYSGALIEYKGRTGDTIEIYQLQSTIGMNLGIDYNYYGLMVLLFSLIPALIVYFLLLAASLRKKPQIKKMKPLERAEQKKIEKYDTKNLETKEEK